MAEKTTALDVFHFDTDRPNFEDLAKDNGFHFWFASKLMEVLGYEDTTNVAKSKPIQRALAACSTLGIPIQENFDFTDNDVKLTRFACYLVAMNSDPKKFNVAAAQAYFAVLAEQFSKYAQDNEAIDRILTREEITQQEKSLSSVVYQSGIASYPLFQNEGYRGMYNMNLKQLREIKKVPDKRSPLDFMGATESAANLLRIRLTEEKIKNERRHGQNELEDAAHIIGQEVRGLLKRTINKTPESLPPAPDIRNVHKGLKQASKGFREIDESISNKKLKKK